MRFPGLPRALVSCALTIAVFGSALAAPAVPARAETLAAPVAGHVEGGAWTAFAFPVRKGVSYQFTLQPESADADLYLYRDALPLDYSIAGGTAIDRVQWQADRDGEVTAWVYGLSAGTAFELTANSVVARNGMRVGLQVGHWRNWEAGPPLSRNTGASGGGKTEAEVNLEIARRTAAYLEEMGYAVDILPTVMPAGYKADAVVAIHADGATSPTRRGFFTDRPARSDVAAAEARLSKTIDAEYAAATGLTRVFRGTENTRYYYGYSKVAARTPMVIIETGFLTSPADREVIVGRPELAARGLASGIDRFLAN